MTHLPVMVMAVDEVIPSGSIDQEGPDEMGKISSCYFCGGILFYHRVTLVENTEHATDTEIFCARCGLQRSGMFDDPFNELDEKMRARSLSEKAKTEVNE